jgi:hypothetical protein
VQSNFENLLNQKVVYALYLWNKKYIVATQNLTHVLINFFQKNKKNKDLHMARIWSIRVKKAICQGDNY